MWQGRVFYTLVSLLLHNTSPVGTHETFCKPWDFPAPFLTAPALFFSPLFAFFPSHQLRKVPVCFLTQLPRQCHVAFKPFPSPAACSCVSSHCPVKAPRLAARSLPEGAAGLIRSTTRAAAAVSYLETVAR